MEAKTNKELIAIARYDDTTFYENRVDPDDLVEQLADRLEAAEKQIAELTDYADRCIDDRNEQINGCDVKDKEIARLRGLIVKLWSSNKIKAAVMQSPVVSPLDFEAIEQIVKEERGEK